MAQYTAYASYVIYFRDATEYDNAVTLASGNLYDHCPFSAAGAFGLPFPVPGGPLGDRGMYTVSYSLAAPGSEIWHPNPSGVFLDPTLDSVIVPGQIPSYGGGNGPDLLLIWSGIIQRIGGGAGITPPTTPISTRRWACGFEMAGDGEVPTLLALSRDASRVFDGMGLAVRSGAASGSRSLNDYSPGLTSRSSWERFYIRLRGPMPAADTQIWRSVGSPSAASGIRFYINSGGALVIANTDLLGTVTVLTTTAALTTGVWILFDVLVSYSDVAFPTSPNATLFVYQNHALIYSNIAFPRSGLGQDSSRHVSSVLGTIVPSTLEADFDDWINAAVPAALDGMDWLAGSHVQTIFSTGFGAAHSVNWVGDYRNLNQGRNALTSSTNQARLTSSTAGAILESVTDEIEEQQAQGSSLGVVALLVSLYSSRVSVDGTLGYSLAGAAAVLTAIVQAGTLAWNRIMYRPSGMIDPDPVVPLNLRHVKGASGGASSVVSLMAEVEHIGTWGVEDDSRALPRTFLTHNAPYPRSIWGATVPPPTAPVLGAQGIYVGNDTGQDINLAQPAHFVWIRPLTSPAGGVKWFSPSVQYGHLGITDRAGPTDYIVRVWVDSAGQAKFSVVGSNSQINATGVSYQWVAFCDPGMRYCLQGAFAHATTLASAINALVDNSFTPEACFFQNEVLNAASNATGLRYRGVGHTGTNGSPLTGAEVANVATFATGAITSRAVVHQAISDAQSVYSAWRTLDGSGAVMVQICSYTGDGTASKLVPLTPASGRTPMFVIVIPHNAQSFMRDPSHAGANSSNVALTTTSTTAITAVGVDTITVGATLNTIAIVYDVFTLFEGYPANTGAPGGDDTWPDPPIVPPPPDSGGACVLTFDAGTDSGGGSGCGVSL